MSCLKLSLGFFLFIVFFLTFLFIIPLGEPVYAQCLTASPNPVVLGNSVNFNFSCGRIYCPGTASWTGGLSSPGWSCGGLSITMTTTGTGNQCLTVGTTPQSCPGSGICTSRADYTACVTVTSSAPSPTPQPAPSFTLSATAAACTGGLSQPVNLSWSNPPTGTQGYILDRGPTFARVASCLPASTTSFTDNPPAGTYTYTLSAANTGCSATSGSATSNSVTTSSCFDYSLTNTGNITMTQSTSGSNTINANLTVGSTQSVSFSASGLPAGATLAFSPSSCNPTCSSTLTITTSSSTPLGTYPITVTGSPLGRTTSFNLVVTGPPGPFTATAVPSCSGTTSKITLSGSSSGATSYIISRSPTRSGLPVTITSSTLSYVDDIVTAGTGYTYTVTANNSSGSVIAGGLASPVTALNCATPFVDLLVNNSNGPITILINNSVTLTWTSTDATSCSASGSWTGAKALNNASGETFTLSATGTYTYTLACTNSNNGLSASDSVTVNVISTLPWIQTTGGDVHSNENIYTPGGP